MNRSAVSTLIEALEAEVNNGGFDQYFYNSAGDNTAETIQALETIGATKDESYRYPDDLASLVMKYNSGRETQS